MSTTLLQRNGLNIHTAEFFVEVYEIAKLLNKRKGKEMYILGTGADHSHMPDNSFRVISGTSGHTKSFFEFADEFACGSALNFLKGALRNDGKNIKRASSDDSVQNPNRKIAVTITNDDTFYDDTIIDPLSPKADNADEAEPSSGIVVETFDNDVRVQESLKKLQSTFQNENGHETSLVIKGTNTDLSHSNGASHENGQSEKTLNQLLRVEVTVPRTPKPVDLSLFEDFVDSTDIRIQITAEIRSVLLSAGLHGCSNSFASSPQSSYIYQPILIDRSNKKPYVFYRFVDSQKAIEAENVLKEKMPPLALKRVGAALFFIFNQPTFDYFTDDDLQKILGGQKYNSILKLRMPQTGLAIHNKHANGTVSKSESNATTEKQPVKTDNVILLTDDDFTKGLLSLELRAHLMKCIRTNLMQHAMVGCNGPLHKNPTASYYYPADMICVSKPFEMYRFRNEESALLGEAALKTFLPASRCKCCGDALFFVLDIEKFALFSDEDLTGILDGKRYDTILSNKQNLPANTSVKKDQSDAFVQTVSTDTTTSTVENQDVTTTSLPLQKDFDTSLAKQLIEAGITKTQYENFIKTFKGAAGEVTATVIVLFLEKICKENNILIQFVTVKGENGKGGIFYDPVEPNFLIRELAGELKKYKMG